MKKQSSGVVPATPQTPALPIPSTFGIDGVRFPNWRPHQSQAVSELLLSPSMFDLIVAPTGFGKSLMYITTALLYGGRALVLTSTKALQRQLMDDFGGLGVVNIKGKANYKCKRLDKGYGCDRGPCNYGQSCDFKASGCYYYDKVREARAATVVITNYSYWVYNNKAMAEGGQESAAEVGIGDFQLIVCDEAHDVPDKVADAYTVGFSTKNEVEAELLQSFGWTDDVEEFRRWAGLAAEKAKGMVKSFREAGRMEMAFSANNAGRKMREGLRYISRLDKTNLLCVPDKKWGTLKFAVVWPFDMAREVLFPASVRKVVFTSATVRPKTVQMLGIKDGDWALAEYPNPIPVERRLLYHIPAIRVNFRSTEMDMQHWLVKADQIIASRMKGTSPPNGIFHTVSYDRRNFVMSRSRHKEIMVSGKGRDLDGVIWAFKRGRGQVLVHPAMTTGYDFPYDEARWQIIGKIAYPDTSDPVTKARCAKDDDYAPYTAMQTLVQTCGRIVRAVDDFGESFIIDDNMRDWFMRRYSKFAPGWFVESFRCMANIPPAVVG